MTLRSTKVSRETTQRLVEFVDMVRLETERQNLVSRSSLAQIWERHIQDSLQLLDLVEAGHWLDVGTGAGLPGLVLAIASEEPVTLVEPRKRRCEFLLRVIEALALENCRLFACRIEQVPTFLADNITARAVASLDTLFGLTHRFASPSAAWIFPKGRSAREEVSAARQSWTGNFELRESVTSSESSIIVARDIRRKEPLRT